MTHLSYHNEIVHGVSIQTFSGSNMDHETIVDFVAEGDSPEEWRMVLVEEGPWRGPVENQLRRIQERMYGCIDAVLDGQLAEQFPGSKGKRIVVQLDCYNVPREDVEDFFRRFSSGVACLDDYRCALERSEFVKEICFDINFESRQ
jgi:hypothetical protein